MTVSGTVEAFDADAFKEGLAALLGAISADNIQIRLSASSVRVAVTIITADEAALEDAAATLTPLLRTPEELSEVLDVHVERVEEPLKLVTGTSAALTANNAARGESSDGALVVVLAASLGALGGAVAAILLGLALRVYLRRQCHRRAKTGFDSPATTGLSAMPARDDTSSRYAVASELMPTPSLPLPPLRYSAAASTGGQLSWRECGVPTDTTRESVPVGNTRNPFFGNEPRENEKHAITAPAQSGSDGDGEELRVCI